MFSSLQIPLPRLQGAKMFPGSAPNGARGTSTDRVIPDLRARLKALEPQHEHPGRCPCRNNSPKWAHGSLNDSQETKGRHIFTYQLFQPQNYTRTIQCLAQKIHSLHVKARCTSQRFCESTIKSRRIVEQVTHRNSSPSSLEARPLGPFRSLFLVRRGYALDGDDNIAGEASPPPAGVSVLAEVNALPRAEG